MDEAESFHGCLLPLLLFFVTFQVLVGGVLFKIEYRILSLESVRERLPKI